MSISAAAGDHPGDTDRDRPQRRPGAFATFSLFIGGIISAVIYMAAMRPRAS